MMVVVIMTMVNAKMVLKMMSGDTDETGHLNTFDFDSPGISCLVQSTLWGVL